MSLDDFSSRVASARGQIKVVAAALIACAGLGAAVWAYSTTRNERNFDKKGAGGVVMGGSRLTPEQRKEMEAQAKAEAEELEKTAAPRQFESIKGPALDALPEKITAAMAGSEAVVGISVADQASLADRVRIALGGMVATTPEEREAAIKALGGEVKEPDPSKPARRNPLSMLLEGAQIDMNNIGVEKPSSFTMGAGQPGSGSFRVTEDVREGEGPGGGSGSGKEPTVTGFKIPAGANVQRITLKPGDPLPPGVKIGPGAGGPNGGPGGPAMRSSFNALMAMRTDSFPAVKDYQAQNLPSVEVKVPAKLKDSKSATPELDVGVIMAQAPSGLWQPAGYNFYCKSPDVQARLMELIAAGRTASAEEKADEKKKEEEKKKLEDEKKREDAEATKPDPTK